jgi:hypothetical protein
MEHREKPGLAGFSARTTNGVLGMARSRIYTVILPMQKISA